MQSSHQETSSSEISIDESLVFNQVTYKVASILGSGLTSKVYKAEQHCTSVINDDVQTNVVALKSVDKKFIEGFQDEVNCLYNCGDHPNIVKMMGFLGGSQDDERHVIALEYCESDLFELVSQSQGLDESVCRYFFAQQIVPAVEHLHKKGICHRDLKLDNILLQGDQAKIADFTFGACMRDSDNNQKLFTRQCGTKSYMAPEILNGYQYQGDKVDVFSLGVCLFMMHMCQNPFPTGQFYHLLWKKPNTFWRQFAKKPSQKFKDLVQNMLAFNPEERFTLDQVKTHEWTDYSIE